MAAKQDQQVTANLPNEHEDVGTLYPQGENLQQQISQRQTRGTRWRILFIVSTMVGIIALMALLYNIVNSSFGYVAMQNSQDPEAVVLAVEEERILSSSHLISSENDDELAEGIAVNPYAIGFFGYAYFQERSDQLRVLTVDAVDPAAETVNSGEYSLARPLFIYSAASVMEEKPQVVTFIQGYLNGVNAEIGKVGYFPADEAVLSTGVATLEEATPEVEIGIQGDIFIAGSSTVYPLTQQMAARLQEEGFNGAIEIESVGTKAGFAQFCSRRSNVDIVNASRAVKRSEADICRDAKRDLLEYRVGTDALAIVVSQENDFLTEVTSEQLRQIFTTATNWSDVSPAWPDEPIARFVPGIDSGTLDFFTESVFNRQLQDLPKETLMGILEANVRSGVLRRWEREQPFAERTQENVYNLVLERVIEPEVVETWSLYDSFFNRDEIETEVNSIENGVLSFRSWLTADFLTSTQSSKAEQAGIRTAILGSLWVIFVTLLFALPLGVGAAVYLEEYAKDNWFNRLIETNINNLAGVPSIIYGMLGLAIFVRALEPMTSGALFGVVEDETTANGRTVISAGMTLGLLILPIIIINAREAVRAVPSSLRQASYGLGATRWQTIWNHVLPSALPGILTGNILAMSRAIGETAPLVVIGASTFIVVDPSGPFSKFTTLPIQIYQWTSRPQDEFRNIAAAAIVVLLLLLLTLNASAVLLRNRYSRQV
ncbi:phosphate ABC transporter permease PstA [Chloroflexi bacterium TSY]|nr:phosphate ABC transporter permease PstA [Chloroflexi bacterium TSY]